LPSLALRVCRLRMPRSTRKRGNRRRRKASSEMYVGDTISAGRAASRTRPGPEIGYAQNFPNMQIIRKPKYRGAMQAWRRCSPAPPGQLSVIGHFSALAGGPSVCQFLDPIMSRTGWTIVNPHTRQTPMLNHVPSPSAPPTQRFPGTESLHECDAPN
jgi:hypothetical protein